MNAFYLKQITPAHKRRLAISALSYARKDGCLVPQACARCGSLENPHAHHPDYDQPLCIVWLCAKCHHQEHAGHKEVRPLSRQRRKQIELKAAGRCITCGKPNDRQRRCHCSICAERAVHGALTRKGGGHVKARFSEGSEPYKRLRVLCISKGYRLTGLAAKVGLSTNFYAHLRRGGTITTRSLARIASGLDLSLSDLAARLFPQDITNSKEEVA